MHVRRPRREISPPVRSAMPKYACVYCGGSTLLGQRSHQASATDQANAATYRARLGKAPLQSAERAHHHCRERARRDLTAPRTKDEVVQAEEVSIVQSTGGGRAWQVQWLTQPCPLCEHAVFLTMLCVSAFPSSPHPLRHHPPSPAHSVRFSTSANTVRTLLLRHSPSALPP